MSKDMANNQNSVR